MAILYILFALFYPLVVHSQGFNSNDDLEPCPIWRGLYEPWYGLTVDLPEKGFCFRNKTQTFSRQGANMKITFWQMAFQWWRADVRLNRVLFAIEDALYSGLSLLWSHAGTASLPLGIHVTLISDPGT